MRPDGRANNQLRPIKFTRSYLKYAEGSVLIEMGDTRVVCGASVVEKVPPFLKGSGHGWVTAEYAMIPRAVPQRIDRELMRGKVAGRTYEIQRLIGRSLRAVTELKLLGERSILLDCDVIQADGGTRTAAITGAFIALVDAVRYLKDKELIEHWPLKDYVAAVSVGIVGGAKLLDLCFIEDSVAEVDMNVVMTGDRKLVEIQGTAETKPFSHEDLNDLIELASKGIVQLILQQKELTGELMKKS